ncbi:MAG: hypothetical protein SGI77_27540 [Pirellulaceae bacterium]|nr:hypothetical protein [Pirellulaceae bacterium]
MRLKTLRNSLIATTAGSMAAMAGVCAWALLGGRTELPSLELPQQPSQVNAIDPSNAATSSIKFDSLLNARFQRPRTEVPINGPSKTVSATPVGFGIQLLGTMIEQTQALALFSDGTGSLDVKGIGQPLNLAPQGVQVESIQPGIATLRYQGKAIKLELAVSTPVRSSASTGDDSDSSSQEDNMPSTNMSANMPTGLMTPVNPDDKPPIGEEDIFAPLPANMDPTRLPEGQP